MSYQQYLEIKNNCEKKIKIFSYAIYIITFLSIVQAGLLILKINVNFNYLNMLILDQLFSMGYSLYAEGNIVFAVFSYGIFALVIIAFIVSSLFCLKGRRYPFLIVIFLYGIDILLCILTASFIHLAIHIVLMGFTIGALKNRNNLVVLKNNIWGYN